MTPNTILSVVDVVKSYRMPAGDVSVLNGVNLTVAKGEIVAIIGASGAGKSTLLHIMGTLDSPTSGAVFHDGVDLFAIGAGEQALKRNQVFGFVFQFYHLMPEFDTLENVLMPTLIGCSFGEVGGGKIAVREKAESLLERIGLKERMRHRPDQLSGGERQRVAIARALINDPEVLLCDEPTGNLDSKAGMEIRDLIWGLNERLGQTVVLVTHDEQVAGNADRIVHVVDGRVE